MSRNCFFSSKLHWNGTRRRIALTALPPLPKKSMSQLACRLSGQLCLALGLCLGGGLLGTQAERASREQLPFELYREQEDLC